MAAKQKCQEEADRTAYTINLANRLVNGLASENIRWRDSVAGFRKSEETTPGDILLITAFVSYVGCFTKTYRVDLIENYWRPQLSALKVKSFKKRFNRKLFFFFIRDQFLLQQILIHYH
jgi:dynein heavy chain